MKGNDARQWVRMVLVSLVSLAVGCGGGDGGGGGGGGSGGGGGGQPQVPFRIAVISDPTIVEQDLFHWNQKLADVVAALNAEPNIDFVVVLGDLGTRLVSAWQENPPPITWRGGIDGALAALRQLDVPFYVTPGEKDYANSVTTEMYEIEFADRTPREADLKTLLGGSYPGSSPWYSFSHKGVRFVALNTMAGPMWQTGLGMTGSLGPEQLAFLDAELRGAEPVVVMSHHRSDLLLEAEGSPTLAETAATGSDNLIAVLSGHAWSYHDYEVAGRPGIGFHSVSQAPAGSRYYAVVEIDPSARTATVVNRASLPFRGPITNPQCQPGVNPVALPTGLGDTYHGVWLTSATTDNPLVNVLLASTDMGETPFGLHVLSENGSSTYPVMIAQARNWTGVPEAGDHAMGTAWPQPVPCARPDWTMGNPCLTAATDISFDLMRIIDEGDLSMCGIRMSSGLDLRLAAKLGPGRDGRMTFAEVEAKGVLEKAPLKAGLEQLLVDGYCGNSFCPVLDRMIIPTPGCLPSDHGQEAACAAGTLRFADVPRQCDLSLGREFELPLRAVLLLSSVFPDRVEFTFGGWGHRMEPTDDFTQNWAIDPNIFAVGCPGE